MAIRHTFTSLIADDTVAAANGEVLPSHWNDDHTNPDIADVTGLQDALDDKQNTLVSGTNIKTVNGNSLLGSGDIAISGTAAWGSITGTLSDQTDLQTALDGKVDENSSITGATKTKITYDAKGLVTSGTDATTADIADSSNRRYVTDAQLTVIGNTSGTNTGDQTSITGITGTKAQFDTACSDGDFVYSGDTPSFSGLTLSSTSFTGITSSGFTGTFTSTTLSGNRTWTMPNNTGTVVLTSNTQTLGNKILDNTNVITVQDSSLTIQDNSDNTKQVQFQLSGLTTGTTRTITVPNADITIQAQLVSATNIKTINGSSILGSGDLVVSGSGGITNGQVQMLRLGAF